MIKYLVNLGKNLFVELIFFIIVRGVSLYNGVTWEKFNLEIFLMFVLVINFMCLISLFMNTDTFIPTGHTAHAKFWTKYLDNNADASHDTEVGEFWGATSASTIKRNYNAHFVILSALFVNSFIYFLYIYPHI